MSRIAFTDVERSAYLGYPLHIADRGTIAVYTPPAQADLRSNVGETGTADRARLPESLPMICCPNCGELCPDGQTRCGECGRALPTAHLTDDLRLHPRVHGCTCGGNGLCVACVLELLETGQPL